MNTSHITLDPLERAAHANSLFFVEQNLVVSFATREDADATYVNARKEAVSAFRMYGPEATNGS